MKLGGRKRGTSTSFVDASSGETLLQIVATSEGESKIAFRLYDSQGALVQDSDGAQSFPEGLRVDARDELLLLLPSEQEGNIEYRLYNSEGRLLTYSDGKRTQIYGMLRVEGSSPNAGYSNQRAST